MRNLIFSSDYWVCEKFTDPHKILADTVDNWYENTSEKQNKKKTKLNSANKSLVYGAD